MLSYLLAVLASCANAAASVLQRKSNRDQPRRDNLRLRLIVDLLHDPIWFLGLLGVIVAFLLQAAALANGALSVVEPILVFELPLTLVLAGIVFHRTLHRREWAACSAIALGLAGVLFFLAPSGGRSRDVSWLTWGVGIGVNLAVITVLVFTARRLAARRAALLGAATGAAFGLTAALMKAMTNAFPDGIVSIFTTWPTYAMIAAGVLAMFLLQSALNAGRLIAAQPGITGADPVVSILWGVVGFGESVRGGVFLVLAAASAVVVGWGVFLLSSSPLAGGAPTASTLDPAPLRGCEAEHPTRPSS
ncbi:MAG: DMT family transporter [Nocardioidaceae bacterium]